MNDLSGILTISGIFLIMAILLFAFLKNMGRIK